MDEHGDHRVISTSSDEAQQRLHSHGSTQMSTIGRWKTLRRLHALVSLDEPGSGSCGPRSTSTTSHSLDPPYPIPIHLALFCGLALSFCSLLVISIHTHVLLSTIPPGGGPDGRVPPDPCPSHVWGKGNIRCGSGRPWPWALSSTVSASTGLGATVPSTPPWRSHWLF